MPPYLRLGSIPRKRHIAHPQRARASRARGSTTKRSSRVAGFSRAYSIVYHLRPPTRVRAARAGRDRCRSELGDEPALRHHHLKTRSIPRAGDPITGRLPLLGNDDVDPRPMPARRAAGGAVPQRRRRRDRLRPLAAAACSTRMFGPLPFRALDYVVIPRCTTYRLEFDAGSAARPAGHRGDRQRVDPRAVPQPRRPDPARCALQRARPPRPARGRRRSTARRRRPC